MGRSAQLQPQIPVQVIRTALSVRQDGALVRRESKRTDLVGEPAGFLVRDRPVVRIQFGDHTRRLGLLRAAWVIAHGAYPLGAVRPKDGDCWNAAPGNLELAKAGPRRADQSRGGRASALEARAEADRALLQALAGQEAPSIAHLARTIGASEAVVSTKLGKLAARALVESPRCCPGRSWLITSKGREIATAGRPLLDDLDRHVLAVLRSSPTPMRQLGLARRCGTCSLTIKRRVAVLAHRGLVTITGPQFRITSAGIEALGPDAVKPTPWVRVEAISAASARDVADRTYIPEATAATRSNAGKLARASAKRNRSTPFNYPVFGMTG
jgi:hypothetical protein